jgi:RNA polymerase sigma factor (sigma-70 family)
MVGTNAGAPTTSTVPTAAVESYERERHRLFGIAYRLLGSALEAEDVLQEAYLRWHRVDHRRVEHPAAFLGRTVKHLALNVLGSADRRRVEYGGLYPPEHAGLVEEPDPLARQERTERLSEGIARVLERLTPTERAVFLLRECFGYSYPEIASLIGKTEENCRQIDSRARRRLREGGPGRPLDPPGHRALLARFLRAARDGEIGELVSLLVADAREQAARRVTA